MFNLEDIIEEPTCFKCLEKPTGIESILTNHPKCLQHFGTYETVLLDIHKLTCSVPIMYYVKQKPMVVNYGTVLTINYVKRYDMLKELSLTNLQKDEFDRLKYLASKVLHSHAPLNGKHCRYN